MMIQNSSPMGQFYYEDEQDLQERLGHFDPPIGVSLFTGAGGFDLGFEWAGFDVRVMVEQDETCCETLRANMHHFNDHTEPTILQKDIREVSTSEILDAAGVGIGGVTAVFGGPPCQGFSLAGNRDPDDERNALYLEMVRIVRRAKPLYFVMENVPGLATMEGGDVIQRVCDEFRQGGYNVKWDILNAANYGVPQRRKRTFIMGRSWVDWRNNVLQTTFSPTSRAEEPENVRERFDSQMLGPVPLYYRRASWAIGLT